MPTRARPENASASATASAGLLAQPHATNAVLVVLQAEEIAARRKVKLELEMINQDDPATCSPQVRPLSHSHNDKGKRASA